MQERKGGVRMDAAVNLREQPDIKELFVVLQDHGLEKERQEVTALVDYLENMGNQFSQMLGELQAVRGELEKMQDKGIRATVSRVVESAESRAQEIWGQISMIGRNLVRSAQNAVAAFKEKGVDALRKAVSAMNIPTVLSAMKDILHSGAESMNRKAEKTAMLAEQLYKARGYRKNIGRILMGRQTKEPTEWAADKGILAKIQRVFLSCGRIFAGMEQKADKALQCVEEFCQGAEKKPSVKADLKQKPDQRRVLPEKQEQLR